MDCYCDYEPCAFQRADWRVARKEHRCDECGRVIRPGERYRVAAGKWGGDFSTCKRCPHCEAVAGALRDRLPCYCDYWHGLWQDDGLPDHLDDLRRAETGDWFYVLRLIARAKQARRAAAGGA
jgi:hypothetical protein